MRECLCLLWRRPLVAAVCCGLLWAAPFASAHPGAVAEGRATCGAEYSNADAAYFIPDIMDSWYIRRLATCEAPVFWTSFNVALEGQEIYIAAITPQIERFKDMLAFNAVLYGPGIAAGQPGLSSVPESIPVELDQSLMSSMGAAYMEPQSDYGTCAFVDTNKVMREFSDVLDGRCSEILTLKTDHEDQLRAGTTTISNWIYSFNHTAAKPGKYYLQSWLTDRTTGAVTQGKYEITMGPWIWYDYASKDVQRIAQSQGTDCMCAVNSLAYSEQNIERLGDLDKGIFAAELPSGTCSSNSSATSACVTQERVPHLSNESAVEWSGVFDLEAGSRYIWSLQAYSDGKSYSYPDPGMNVFITEYAETDEEDIIRVANNALSAQNPDSKVGTRGILSILPFQEQKPETIVFDGTKQTLLYLEPQKDGPIMVFTQHLPSEFMAYFMVNEATGEFIFPSSSRQYGGIDPKDYKGDLAINFGAEELETGNDSSARRAATGYSGAAAMLAVIACSWFRLIL